MPQDGRKTNPRARGGPSSVASFYLPQDIGGVAYFELPYSILGSNIKSYGGYLSYTLTYKRGVQVYAPDVILKVSKQLIFSHQNVNKQLTF